MEANRQSGGRCGVTLAWAEQARSSSLPPMVKAADTILAHRSGILAWYDDHLSTGKVEGIDNKIKVLGRIITTLEA